MPTQAQRQRDWEFVAELKPEDGRAKTGAPGLEGSAADRAFLASLPPSASFASGATRQSPAGSAGAEAAFEPPGSSASWGVRGAVDPAMGRGNDGAAALGDGGSGVQLAAYQPSRGRGATPVKSQRTATEPQPAPVKVPPPGDAGSKSQQAASPLVTARGGAPGAGNSGGVRPNTEGAAPTQPPGVSNETGSRRLLPNTVDPLTLRPVKSRQKVTRSVSGGTGSPGTSVTYYEDPNEPEWKRLGKQVGRLIPGVGAAIEGHERIYDQLIDAQQNGAAPRSPQLAPPGSPERRSQDLRLARLQPLVEEYNRALTSGLRGEQMEGVMPTDSIILYPPYIRELPNLYLKYGKQWNWKDFGHFLREKGITKLSSWEQQVLNTAITARKIEWANRAATDANMAAEVAIFVAGEIAGGFVAPYVLKGLGWAGQAAKATRLGKAVTGLAETAKASRPAQLVRLGKLASPGMENTMDGAGALIRALAPTEGKIRDAVANGIQEALTYAIQNPDRQADEAIRRALAGGGLTYFFNSGLHLGASGWRRLRRIYHETRPSSAWEANRAFAAELRRLKAEGEQGLVRTDPAASRMTASPGEVVKSGNRPAASSPNVSGTPPSLRPADPGGARLAKAVTASGALQQQAIRSGKGQAGWLRWYDVGGLPQARPAREAMYAHLAARYPDMLNQRWTIPGRGSGTLRELLVERGVLPGEVGDLYAWGQAWRRGPRAKPETYAAIKATAGGTAPNIPGRKVGGLPFQQPEGVLALSSEGKWVEVAKSPEFQRDINKYNQITRHVFNTLSFWPRIKAAKNADEVVRALESGKVRFYHLPGVTNSAIFEMVIPETGEVYYHLQSDVFKDKSGKALRHELLHLAAILNGERERPAAQFLLNFPHELAVSWATTPGIAAAETTLAGGVLGVGAWLTAPHIQNLAQQLRQPKKK